jgi:hypothetical protein
MRKRSAWRWSCTALTFVGLIVIALNVEKMAGATVLSNLLLAYAHRAPSVWAAITSTTALWVAVAVTAYTAGLWSEVLSRKLAEPKRIDTERKLAEDCEHMSGILRKTAYLAEHDTHNYLFKLRVDLMTLSLVLSSGPGRIPIELSSSSEKAALASADLLDELAAALREGNRAKYKEAARRFSSLDSKPPSPPANANPAGPPRP